jgi:hypothetical protein
MEDKKDEPVPYRYRAEMEKMVLVLGAAFLGVLNALVQTDAVTSLRLGLAIATGCFLVAFFAFLFLHAIRIQGDHLKSPKGFDFLIGIAAVAGVSGVAAILWGVVLDATHSLNVL